MTDTYRLTLRLTPHGRLVLASADDTPEMDGALARRIEQAFAKGAGHGLLRLGAAEVAHILPPVFAYWRALGGRYVASLCTRPDVEGIRRKGVVLACLMRFKQICYHPSQWLGDGAWAENDSGKWVRLRELCEIIAAKQEKALVFTQFREVTAPLAAFLGGVFGRPGLVLHGETEVKKRQALVTRFQEDESVPFFVLSLKAGGSGLNLTAASHVVDFDRWWNPAVENQATDRASRIGQTKHVLVHKFVCRGSWRRRSTPSSNRSSSCRRSCWKGAPR